MFYSDIASAVISTRITRRSNTYCLCDLGDSPSGNHPELGLFCFVFYDSTPLVNPDTEATSNCDLLLDPITAKETNTG